MTTARPILTVLALAVVALVLFIVLVLATESRTFIGRLSERIWRRLGRIALWWWEWRDRRNK